MCPVIQSSSLSTALITNCSPLSVVFSGGFSLCTILSTYTLLENIRSRQDPDWAIQKFPLFSSAPQNWNQLDQATLTSRTVESLKTRYSQRPSGDKIRAPFTVGVMSLVASATYLTQIQNQRLVCKIFSLVDGTDVLPCAYCFEVWGFHSLFGMALHDAFPISSKVVN